jgi:hypothetical protein
VSISDDSFPYYSSRDETRRGHNALCWSLCIASAFTRWDHGALRQSSCHHASDATTVRQPLPVSLHTLNFMWMTSRCRDDRGFKVAIQGWIGRTVNFEQEGVWGFMMFLLYREISVEICTISICTYLYEIWFSVLWHTSNHYKFRGLNRWWCISISFWKTIEKEFERKKNEFHEWFTIYQTN